MDNITKLCHAKVGNRLRLVDSDLNVGTDVFILTAEEHSGRRAARPGMSHGLYDDQRRLSLVHAVSGLVRPIPNLSSRVQILQEADSRESEITATEFERVLSPEETVAKSISALEELRALPIERRSTAEIEAIIAMMSSSLTPASRALRRRFAVAYRVGAGKRSRIGSSLWIRPGEGTSPEFVEGFDSLGDAVIKARSFFSSMTHDTFVVYVLDRGEGCGNTEVGGEVLVRLDCSVNAPLGV